MYLCCPEMMESPCGRRYTSRESIRFALTVDTYNILRRLNPDVAQKRAEFDELVDSYLAYLLERGPLQPCSCTYCLKAKEEDPTIFSDLIGKAKDVGPEVLHSFIVTTLEALGPNARDLLSSCGSNRDLIVILESLSSHGWCILYSGEMMASLLYLKKPRIAFHLRKGSPYLFHKKYFKKRYTQLQEVEVEGKSLGSQIHPSILDSDSLRLQLVLEILLVLFGGDPMTTSSLKLIWMAVPFPYISATEMFTQLEPFFIEGEDIKLWDVCKEYRKRNPLFEVPEVTQPRSLKHLIGVQVRTNMCKANSIEDEAIDGLDIPMDLKDYLKLPFTETPILKNSFYSAMAAMENLGIRF